MLATAAISDHKVIHQEPIGNKVVLSIIDNILLCMELDGIHVVTVQTGSNLIRITQMKITSTLLHINPIVGHQNEKSRN
ncbi:hypothetical protein UB51_25215 [Paenibacillus sp. IHBB 10380]|nr:hypothetical protein UB51_25215 [Paenibacillus sp. IHBB 10380]